MNGAAAKILVVDDEAIARANLARVLAHDGHETVQAGGGSIALEMLQHGEYDLVLTDLIMPDMGGLELLERVHARFPGTEVIVVTGYPMVETAVEAMRKGAYHYLAKPYQLDEARLLVARALEKRRLYLEVARMRSLLETREGPLLLGDAPVMRELKRTIARVAPSDASVLILGDTGTGKELAARSIHALSRRAGGRFLAVNCGALQEELLESELFGHEQGAFSGAVRRKPGLFEAACGGTLFLDELGEMSPAMQVKLLRALQERVIRRVGGTRDIEVDVRVLAATNRNLRLEVSRGNFREDLYYRLAVITLRMPALAERREDIPLLVAHFVEKVVADNNMPSKTFSTEALNYLTGYEWPGNIRQLENVVESCLVLVPGSVIEVDNLPAEIRDEESQFKSAVDLLPVQLDLADTLEKIEAALIRRALVRADLVQVKAAEYLGISKSLLQYKLKKYGITGH